MIRKVKTTAGSSRSGSNLKSQLFPKKGNTLDPYNHRPISLLSIPGKIFEKVVCNSLDDHILCNNILNDRQWGFRKSYSTESLLLHLTEIWKRGLDNDCKVAVLFIDFRNAFDCVNPTILSAKLKAVGVLEKLWEWINDYLSNRMQRTLVSGAYLELRPVKIGVPQKSLLGPRLFAIYDNDLPEFINNGKVYMYADDTSIYAIGNTVDEISMGLQAILDQVQTWCLKNRLVVHERKSEAMILIISPFIGPMKPLRWGEEVIQYKSSSHCLGVLIHNKLSCSLHIE